MVDFAVVLSSIIDVESAAALHGIDPSQAVSNFSGPQQAIGLAVRQIKDQQRYTGLDRAINQDCGGTRMPTLKFTPNLRRHVATPAAQVNGATVLQVLEAYFQVNPQARGYILDDQGALRKHMAIFSIKN